MKHALAFQLAGLLLMLGCAPSADIGMPPDEGQGTMSTASAVEPDAGAEKLEIELSVVDESAFADVVRQHRGRVVLVDCWATWCGPCVEQFPHTVEMYRRFTGEGLSVISVSFDEPASRQTVLEFLRRQQATFDNLLSKYGGSPQAMEAFEIPGGALPHYKLYDRTGELSATFALDPTAAVQFTAADIEAKVVELLESSDP